MLTLITVWATNLWTKFYKQLVIGVAVVGALFTIYLKGRTDANTQNERAVLREDLENRNVSDDVRRDVARAAAPADRLRRWTRPGN